MYSLVINFIEIDTVYYYTAHYPYFNYTIQSIVSSTILILIFLRGGCDEISRGKTADWGEQHTRKEAPLFETIKWLVKHVNEIEKD